MRAHLALGVTDMHLGFDGLAAQVQTVRKADPFCGHLFLFRGGRGDAEHRAAGDAAGGSGLALADAELEARDLGTLLKHVWFKRNRLNQSPCFRFKCL